jgi:hypothetical protein
MRSCWSNLVAKYSGVSLFIYADLFEVVPVYCSWQDALRLFITRRVSMPTRCHEELCYVDSRQYTLLLPIPSSAKIGSRQITSL